jgi:hypothetical protein
MTTKENSVIERLIPLAVKHQKADEYISGTYWDRDRKMGCSVGCSIADLEKLGVLNGVEYGDHAALAQATDVPEMLWRLSDNIFEGLPHAERPGWTPRFLRAIKRAKNLANAPARIMARLAERFAKDAIRDDVRDACTVGALLWRRRASGDEPAEIEWDAAWEQADAAWKQADAAWEQADAAWEQADAARKQADAARKQAYAARKQADAARKQAYAARKQAYAARKQADAARKQAYAARKQADVAWKQADAAWEQADAAWEQWWSWCADVVCEEIAA